MSEAWVVHASPLILFSRIARLDLIERLAPAILIPNAVIEEVRAGQQKIQRLQPPSHGPRSTTSRSSPASSTGISGRASLKSSHIASAVRDGRCSMIAPPVAAPPLTTCR